MTSGTGYSRTNRLNAAYACSEGTTSFKHDKDFFDVPTPALSWQTWESTLSPDSILAIQPIRHVYKIIRLRGRASWKIID